MTRNATANRKVRAIASLFGLSYLLIVSVWICTGIEENKPTTKKHFSEHTIMDRPEITRLLFHPVKVAPNVPPPGAVDIHPQVDDGTIIGCRLYSHSVTAPTLIFFHGNGEIIPDYDDVGPRYVQEGMNFLVTEYRGYGWSGGTPLASTLLSDSNTLFVALKEWLADHDYTGALFIMGRSLGSASAIDVAVNHSDAVCGLIVESGFAKTLPLAKVLGVDLEKMEITEEQTFNNSKKIGKFTKPTFILHGQYDQLIPLWQAETLQAESGAKNKEFQIVPGADHNSLIAVAGQLYFQAIRKFVEKAACLTPDWRERRRQFKAQKQKNTAAE
jgi:pimeloyl-ACP methyl ester carboxylesterase